jgi:regulator of RNase E activity RraA
MLSEADADFLRSIDTPTVCNIVEMVAPDRRGHGYTTKHLHCLFPDLPPMLAYAKTVTIRSKDAFAHGDADYAAKRMAYFDYIATEPQPSVVVVQDLDEPAGYGAFWGEVQSNVHKALGCIGTITSGAVRDIPQIAPGFQMLAGSVAPSHSYVHVVDFGHYINVHGMPVKSGELIHFDRHGAVVVPVDKIGMMREALELLLKTEARIITAAKAPGATVESIKAAIKG